MSPPTRQKLVYRIVVTPVHPVKHQEFRTPTSLIEFPLYVGISTSATIDSTRASAPA